MSKKEKENQEGSKILQSVKGYAGDVTTILYTVAKLSFDLTKDTFKMIFNVAKSIGNFLLESKKEDKLEDQNLQENSPNKSTPTKDNIEESKAAKNSKETPSVAADVGAPDSTPKNNDRVSDHER